MTEFNINLLQKPCLSVTETQMVLNLSAASVKRRIGEGVLKTIPRDNLYQKILILTDSIQKYLQSGGRV